MKKSSYLPTAAQGKVIRLNNFVSKFAAVAAQFVRHQKFLILMMSCAALLFLIPPCSAQWQQTNGPYGGSINCIASDGTNIFAGTQVGDVFLSTNNGSSWTAVNTGLTGTGVQSLAISGTNIFAGTNVGVFLSTNNGSSWTAVNTGLTNTDVSALAISGTNIFAGIENGGVFLSSNNGSSWTAVNTGLTTTFVYSLAISGTNIFAGTNVGVFLSTNNGSNWVAVNNGLPPSTFVFSFAISGTNIFAGTNGGVFLSTNNGGLWTAVNTGLTTTDVRSLAISGSNIFAGTNGAGLFLSSNNGGLWTTVNTGLTNLRVFSLAINGTNIFAGTLGAGVFLSTNNGSSWATVNTGLTNASVSSFAISGTNIFAGTGGGVFLSTNNGGSWTAVNTGLTDTNVRSLAISGTNIFAGTGGGGVYLSTNNGSSWTAVNTGLTNLTVFSLAISGTNIFAGTFTGGVFLSTNNGGFWTAVGTGLTNKLVFSLALSGTNIFAGTSGAGGGVFLSTNNGSTWTAVNTGLTNTNVKSLAISGTNIFAGTYGGVFLSTNNGGLWNAVNIGLTNTVVNSLAISGTNIFAGTAVGGVWVRPLSEMILLVTTAQTNVSCNGGSDGTASATAAGGLPPYTYLWTGGQSASAATGLSAGTYTVTARDALNDSAAAAVTITEPPPLTVAIDSFKDVSACNGNDGGIYITASGGTGPYTYLWMPGGFTTEDIPGIAPGSYTVTVSDTAGCTNTFSQNIYVKPPPTPLSICITTVDSIASSKNIIVWEKPVTTAIDSFRIYREISSVYTPIGTVSYDSLSIFTDSTNGVDPKTSSYFYKISSVDTNGVEGPLSNAHETMFLQVTQPNPPALDLTWTDYCGFPVLKYYIERDGNNTNSWMRIDSVNWGTNVYVDSFPPTDSAKYRIEALPPTPCTATIIKNPEPMATTVRSTKSNGDNKITSPPASIAENSLSTDGWLKVYPNPNQGEFNVQCLKFKTGEQYELKIYNVLGELMYQSPILSIQSLIILSKVPCGIYHLQVIQDGRTMNRKIVIQ